MINYKIASVIDLLNEKKITSEQANKLFDTIIKGGE